MTNLTHPYISATALARTYLYMCGWREYGASPELTEEVEDIEALDVTNAAVEDVKGHNDEPAVGMFLGESLEALEMTGLDLLCGLDLDGHARITQHGIDFQTGVGAPICEFVLAMGVVQVGNKLLNDQMLKGMAVVCSSANQLLAMCEVVGHTNIEIIEAWSLHQTTLHHLGVGGDAIADEGIHEDVEVGTDGCGMNAAVLSNVLVVDDFSIRERRNLKKPIEGFQTPYQRLFFDFLFQIHIQISSDASSRIPSEVVGRQHAEVDGTVDVEVWDFCTHQRVEINGKGAPAKGIVTLALQLAGTGATEDKNEVTSHNEPMHFVEQLRNLGNLINDNERSFWLVLQHLIELGWIAHEAGFDAGIEQVKIDGVWKLLLQKGRFTSLTGSKEEDASIKLLAQLEKACKHRRTYILMSDSYYLKYWLTTTIMIKNIGFYPQYSIKSERKDKALCVNIKEKRRKAYLYNTNFRIIYALAA